LKASWNFYTARSLIGYMMDDDRVTADELFAASSIFTLLAWGFADLYLAIQAWLQGALSVRLCPAGRSAWLKCSP